MTKPIELSTTSPESTFNLGRLIGDILLPGDIILLVGELGSGKTALVRGIAAGLSIVDRVVSPTFVLVRSYRGRLELIHADLYRLGSDAQEDLEFLDLGSVDSVTVVEWGDLSGDFYFSLEPLVIEFTQDSGVDRMVRHISIRWIGKRFGSRITPELFNDIEPTQPPSESNCVSGKKLLTYREPKVMK